MEIASDDIPMPQPTAATEVARLVDDARALWERNALSNSKVPLRRALELAEMSLGADDPLVAVVLSHLGWLASACKRHDEAEADYRRALAIREARLGPSHPDTLRAIEDLAAALFKADACDEEADALALRAIDAHEDAGRDDAEFAGLIAAVGWRRYWIGRYVEAEPMLLRALAMRERLLGYGDPATADTAKKLAVMYDHRGFDVDPEPYYRKALDGFEAALGADHPDAFEARYRLADYLDRQGRDYEAAPLFDDLVARILSPDPTVSADRAHWMLGPCCDHLRAAGRDDEAEAIEVWAVSADPSLELCRADAEQAERAYGPESPELADALRHLANAYAEAGRLDEADEAARRTHAILLARLGPDDPASSEAAAGIAKVREYAEWHAAHRPAPRRLGRDRPKLFDGEPWRDERRPDLIRTYLASAAEERDEDDPTGAVGAIVGMSFMADLDEQWDVIRELIAESPDDDRVLQVIAAGPLEDFLGRFNEAIDRVEDEAGRNPRFRRVLSGVWKHRMSDPVWGRVRAIQATVPDPLPEMRPFAADSPTCEK